MTLQEAYDEIISKQEDLKAIRKAEDKREREDFLQQLTASLISQQRTDLGEYMSIFVDEGITITVDWLSFLNVIRDMQEDDITENSIWINLYLDKGETQAIIKSRVRINRLSGELTVVNWGFNDHVYIPGSKSNLDDFILWLYDKFKEV